MISKSVRSESGQAIFLLSLALVGMLGFIALSIDGGRIMSDQRKAQNTADTAAMAGAIVMVCVVVLVPTSGIVVLDVYVPWNVSSDWPPRGP